jgi:hypothetical protein
MDQIDPTLRQRCVGEIIVRCPQHRADAAHKLVRLHLMASGQLECLIGPNGGLLGLFRTIPYNYFCGSRSFTALSAQPTLHGSGHRRRNLPANAARLIKPSPAILPWQYRPT